MLAKNMPPDRSFLRIWVAARSSSLSSSRWGSELSIEITASKPDVKTFLGRPWRGYATTIYLNTKMSDVVRPEGWNNWGHPDREKTTRYAEFGSTGPGATPDKRAPWARQLSADEAKAITIEKVLGGNDAWKPKTSFDENESGGSH